MKNGFVDTPTSIHLYLYLYLYCRPLWGAWIQAGAEPAAVLDVAKQKLLKATQWSSVPPDNQQYASTSVLASRAALLLSGAVSLHLFDNNTFS